MSIRELRAALHQLNVPTNGMIEKAEMVAALEAALNVLLIS